MDINLKVSVIIPNYNNGRYVGDCLRSITNQTHRPIEVLIVDDASTDESVTEILQQIKVFSSEGVFFNLIRNSENSGVSVSRRIGVERASGNILTTIDPDDYFSDSLLFARACSVLMDFYGRNEKCIVGSMTCLVDEGGDVIKIRRANSISSTREPFSLLSRKVEVPANFFGFKEDLIPFYEGMKGDLYEDLEMKMKVVERMKLVMIRRVGLCYRQHRVGLSSVSRFRHIKRLLGIYFEWFPKFPVMDLRHFLFFGFVFLILVKRK